MAASLDEAEVKNILRQVEFYFSDSNLPRDNFLKKTVQESEDGLVSLGLICSFTRMRNHLGLGNVKAEEVPEETVAAVAEALRKSSFLKVSEDGKRIGRSTELPEPEVNSVRLPRLVGDKRCFCGTALIEFSEEESVKKVLTESLIYADAELELKPKKDFDDEREKQMEEFEKSRPDKNNSNGSYPKGLIMSFKLKSIEQVSEANKNGKDKKIIHDADKENGGMVAEDQTLDAKKEKSAEDVREEKSETTAADDSNVIEHDKSPEDAKNESDESANQAKEIADKTAGNEKDVVKREDLKEVFQKFGTVKYIDFMMGEESGYIRFENPDAAVKARAAAVLTDEGGLVVKNSIATLEPLSGDAEMEYWSLLRGNQEKNRDSKGNYRGRGRSNRGRYFDAKRHRQGGNAGDGQPNKTHKSN